MRRFREVASRSPTSCSTPSAAKLPSQKEAERGFLPAPPQAETWNRVYLPVTGVVVVVAGFTVSVPTVSSPIN
ncbi:MAG: hypothetical protein NTX23_06260, partial [Candidatus Bipolaricaulota bacterium]|nr:hypothetical protein [Candidatus Bipolaricaulota bacterium]